MTYRLRLLGPFEFTAPSGAVIAVAGKKLQALVAMLALAGGSPVPRSRLTAVFWGDRGEAQARNSLRQAFSALRKAFAEHGEFPFTVTEQVAAIDPKALHTDTAALEAGGEPIGKGEFLEGLDIHGEAAEDWLRAERQRIGKLVSDRLSQHLAVSEAAGDSVAAMAAAEALLRADPLNERAYRALARAMAAAGDRAAALKQLQACGELLKAELGVEPDPETVRLAEEIRKGPPATAAATPAIHGMLPTVAVLSFANLSADPNQQYFSDGITEDIITELNRFQSLLVIAGSSSFAFRERETDPVDLGKKLDVQYIVHGSVRTAGSRIRISVQLIDVSTGGHLWSERYDREVADIFEIQDEIATTVATMVSGRIELANKIKSERKPPGDVNAYDLVLLAQWTFYNDKPLSETQRLLERAIEIDPVYAEAHAKLAIHHAYSIFVLGLDSREIAPLVVRHGSEAARLAPADAMIHGPLSEGFAFVGEHALAAHHLERAMSINPNSFLVMAHCAEAIALLGDHQRAVELIEKARKRDPYSVQAFRETSFDIYYLLGRYHSAMEQFVGWPDPQIHTGLAKAAALAQLGRMAEAEAALRELDARRPKGWDVRVVAQNYYRMCALPEDGEHWLDGFRKAGLDL